MPHQISATVILEQFFINNQLAVMKHAEKHVYRLAMVVPNGELIAYLHLRDESSKLIFYIMAPINVAESERVLVAEFITRLNEELLVGNFEMDYGDGEVRYKRSLSFKDVELTELMIYNVVYPSSEIMYTYFPTLLTVIGGGLSPQEALDRHETQEFDMKNTSSVIVNQFLHEDGWEPRQIDDGIFRFWYRSQKGLYYCLIYVVDYLSSFTVYVRMPRAIPESKVPSVIDWITKVNYGLWLGNFEFDFEEGGVVFKNGLDFDAFSLTPKLIRNTLYAALTTSDKYLPNLMNVLNDAV